MTIYKKIKMKYPRVKPIIFHDAGNIYIIGGGGKFSKDMAHRITEVFNIEDIFKESFE